MQRVAPAPVRAPVPVAAVRPAPALKLVGTVAAGAASFATVLHTADSQVLQLRVGDHVDGYAVTAIEPGRLVLDGAAQPLVIEPERTAAAPASPPPSAATPAAPQVEQPNYPEGEAPWDLAPPFRH
ncbi:hypothetical protein [Ramlibacter agri]|uniref:hypothetical protein n=1 Tax=Ramlibacter agri TaxID=2728837 RepID=UPI00146DD92B|nr:hypothetical protein [Ramlibacter agri]